MNRRIEFSSDGSSFTGIVFDKNEPALKVSVRLNDKPLKGKNLYKSPLIYRFLIPIATRDGFRLVKTASQGKGKRYLFNNESVAITFNSKTRLGRAVKDLEFQLENFQWDPDFNNVFRI